MANFNRLMIAAPKSGSGKTTVVLGLLAALSEKKKVCAIKCGPDYIDPLFHQSMLNIATENLDTFFTDDEKTKELFINHSSGYDFSLIEGVMGLYDGLGGIEERGSSYDLARTLDCPIVLVIDAKGMAKSVLAEIAGFLHYDSKHLIKGVILNRTTKGMFDILSPLIEDELQIKALGFLPYDEKLSISSRHLGLLLPDEIADIKQKIKLAKEAVYSGIDLDAIISIADDAKNLDCDKNEKAIDSKNNNSRQKDAFALRQVDGGQAPIVAVAKDEAFCFLYKSNIALLEALGVRIEYFSPIHDKKLPKNAAGLILPGGYPELYKKELQENVSMQQAIAKAIKKNMPSIAECGGFMYLHDVLIEDDSSFELCNIIPATLTKKERLVRFGYIDMQPKVKTFLSENEIIKGHEFHYYDSTDNGCDIVATKPSTKKTYDCIHANESHWWGFPHLYFESNPSFAKNFCDAVRTFDKRMKNE